MSAVLQAPDGAPLLRYSKDMRSGVGGATKTKTTTGVVSAVSAGGGSSSTLGIVYISGASSRRNLNASLLSADKNCWWWGHKTDKEYSSLTPGEELLFVFAVKAAEGQSATNFARSREEDVSQHWVAETVMRAVVHRAWQAAGDEEAPWPDSPGSVLFMVLSPCTLGPLD
jgi:hypothetical protein